MLQEMAYFAEFPVATQSYICLALAARSGCPQAAARQAATKEEACSFAARVQFYGNLEQIAAAIPTDDDVASATRLMRWLVPLTVFDIAHTALDSFEAYRFLYERLLGAAVRPWLLGAFCTAAALPQLHPDHRRRLMQSIDEDSGDPRSWSVREPLFFPQSVEAED